VSVMQACLGVVPLVMVSFGCAQDSRRHTPFAMSDSAGVEVVITQIPAWQSGGRWRIDEKPVLRLGLTEGAQPYLFEDVRSVLVLEDGRIVVADGLSNEIRIFGESGHHIRTIGRAGQGPGEFESIDWVDQCGDGLLALDLRQQRVTELSVEGDLGKTFSLLEPGFDRVPYRSRCGPDGSFIVVGWGEYRLPAEGTTFELYQETAPLWLIDRDAAPLLKIGDYVSSERVFMVNPATGGRGSGPHPFGRSVVFAMSRDLVFVGTSERLQIEMRSRRGELIRIFRGPEEDLEVTPEVVAHFRSLDLPRPDSILRARLDEHDMAMPSGVPAYTEFVVDPSGHLWVERFDMLGFERERWGVFSPSGEFLGHLEMPDGFRLVDVSEDLLIGVSEDHLGVERVELYRLTRG
jgi:hypothetical protein